MKEKAEMREEGILFADETSDEVTRPLTSSNGDAIALVVQQPNATASPRSPIQTKSPESAEDDASFSGLSPEPQIDHSLPDFLSTRIGFESPDGVGEGGSFPVALPPPSLSSIPDVNVYQHKKTLAQGMMDLALLSANANQLRYVLQTDGRHPYFYPSLTMIGASLFLQIAVGIGLIWNSRYNVKDDAQMCKANQANNLTVIGIFLVTILNVFISSFGVVDQPVTPVVS